VGGGSGIVKKKKSRRGIKKNKERSVEFQPLAIRSSLHSSSFSECVQRKAYNETI